MKKQIDEVRITFRIPKDIYDKIVDSAEKNRRSINNEMIVALEEFIRKNNEGK